MADIVSSATAPFKTDSFYPNAVSLSNSTGFSLHFSVLQDKNSIDFTS